VIFLHDLRFSSVRAQSWLDDRERNEAIGELSDTDAEGFYKVRAALMARIRTRLSRMEE
jgi:hypothetical protein